MGNTNSVSKLDYEELKDRYNKMKTKYETESISSNVYKNNLEDLEKKLVQSNLNYDDLQDENEINLKKIEAINSSYESEIINYSNKLTDLERLLKLTTSDKIELETKNTTLKNKNTDLETTNNVLKSKIDLLENKIEHLVVNHERTNNINIFKTNIDNKLNFFNTNKDIIVSDILENNNTLIPDFIEVDIISNLYNYIVKLISNDIEKELNKF